MLFQLPAGAEQAAEQAERARSDQLYGEAQRQLARQDDARALALLREYLEFTSANAHRPERVFWAIDQIGHVYLSRKRDPDGALAFFQKMRADTRLSELDRSAIDEWIAVATEWKQTRSETTGLRDPKLLMERGRRYYDSGLRKADRLGGINFANADFHIAEGYLRRYAVLHNERSQIDDALYMLGAIRHHARMDLDHWSDNYYLKEVIRRFPHSEVASKAFDLLRREVTNAYKPQEIPADLSERLKLYEELARPAQPR